MPKFDSFERFYPKNRDEWRAWLVENHPVSKGVLLISYLKATGKPYVGYADSVEEALCFGWIDSIKFRIDTESSVLLFTPRKPKSNWSALNKTRVEKLAAAGLMQPAGQKMVDLAQKTGTWDALNEVDALVVPTDLSTAFGLFQNAKNNWEAFSPSSRKGILEWILNAKTPETRAKRIHETASLAEQNLKANQYVKKV